MADEAPELRQDRREGSELTEETDGSGQVREGSDPAPLFLRGAGKPAAGARGRGDQDASKHQAACHRHPYAFKGASTDLMSPVGAFLDALLELPERVLDGLPRRVHCARHPLDV
jgi:hypothetical protein